MGDVALMDNLGFLRECKGLRQCELHAEDNMGITNVGAVRFVMDVVVPLVTQDRRLAAFELQLSRTNCDETTARDLRDTVLAHGCPQVHVGA